MNISYDNTHETAIDNDTGLAYRRIYRHLDYIWNSHHKPFKSGIKDFIEFDDPVDNYHVIIFHGYDTGYIFPRIYNELLEKITDPDLEYPVILFCCFPKQTRDSNPELADYIKGDSTHENFVTSAHKLKEFWVYDCIE